MMQIEYIAPFGCMDERWKELMNGIFKVTVGAPPVAVRRKNRFTSSTKFLEAPAPSAESESSITSLKTRVKRTPEMRDGYMSRRNQARRKRRYNRRKDVLAHGKETAVNS